jgi:hypothetical protein
MTHICIARKMTLYTGDELQMGNTRRHQHTKCNSKARITTSNTKQSGKPKPNLKFNSLHGQPRMKRSSRRTTSLLGVFSITPYAAVPNPTRNAATPPHGLQLHKRSASVDLVMVLFCRFTTTEPTCR